MELSHGRCHIISHYVDANNLDACARDAGKVAP
jgi:hypothetical protein